MIRGSFRPMFNELFELYDSQRETGLADSVVPSLTAAADSVVSSMYPHDVFQGDILEGLVIRYVPFTETNKHDRARLDRLAVTSQSLLSKIPVDLPDCHQLVQELCSDNDDDDDMKVSPILKTNVRTLFQDTRIDAKGGDASMISFEQALRRILEAADGTRRSVTRIPKSANVDIPSLVASLTASDDMETQRIAKVIRSLKQLNKRIIYSVMQETNGNGDNDDDMTGGSASFMSFTISRSNSTDRLQMRMP